MNPTDFSSLALSPELLAVVAELGFEKMTPIQQQSIPVLLGGRDLVGQSKTGSGKTAAFALPILQKLNLEKRDIQALILCPTRELCTQVAREIRRLGRKLPGLQVAALYGGEPIRTQLASMQNGAHIVVGTPGRILDHISRQTLTMGFVKTLVLDEADRMLDMGFEEEMLQIMDDVPATRQTVFFSATFPESMKAMSKKYQIQPQFVTIADAPEAGPAIEQRFYFVPAEDKIKVLFQILQQEKPTSTLVFCRLKTTTLELVEALEAREIRAGALNGDLEQKDRERVMAMFRNGSLRVLVATDVAARGLDVPDLEVVVNFDFPQDAETYVHRIGRTGRAGKEGRAISMGTRVEQSLTIKYSELAGGRLEMIEREPSHYRVGQVPLEAKMQTLMISGGRKDKVRPGDLLGALTGEAGGLEGADVGKIEIHDAFSYVAVSTKVARLAVERLQKGKIKGRSFQARIIK